jgi:hypothetical protein
MKQFRIRQLLESIAWSSVALAAFKAFLWLDGPRYITTAAPVRTNGFSIWVLWLAAGIAAGNAVGALVGRRRAWSIVGICWVFLLSVLWDYLSYFG